MGCDNTWGVWRWSCGTFAISLLSPANVTGGGFGELFDTQLNGAVYAQPIVQQPTVLAVTENDHAYGLNSTTVAIEWQDNFGPQANPLVQIGCADIGANLGLEMCKVY